MPFIPVNLGAAKESRPVKNGVYDLQVVSVEEAKTKAGAPQLLVSIAIEGHDDTPNVRQYMSLPNNGDEPDKAKFKALLLKRFFTLFGVPVRADGFDTEALLGARARGELTITEPDDNGNIYNRVTVPRLRDEGIMGEKAVTQGSSSRKPPKV